MLAKNKTYVHSHDLYTKFPTLGVANPYNTLKLNSIKFIVSSNSLPTNSKLFYLLSNLSQSITGQVPAIIKAKKSVASFKLRKNSPVAIYTTLRKHRAFTFLNLLTFFYIPQLISLNPKYRFPNPVCSGGKPRSQSCLYSFGFNDISYFTHIHPLALQPSSALSLTKNSGVSSKPSNKKGSTPSNQSSFGFKQIGGYVQFNITSLFRKSALLTSSNKIENHLKISKSTGDLKFTPQYFYITQLLSYPFS